MLQPNDLSQTNNSEASTTTSLQPMGFTDILDTIFSLYRNHFRLIFGICIVYFVLMLGINLFTASQRFSFPILVYGAWQLDTCHHLLDYHFDWTIFYRCAPVRRCPILLRQADYRWDRIQTDYTPVLALPWK